MDPHDLALAYSLSTIAGLRASLTVFAVTVAIHFHAFAPPAALEWLSSDNTLMVAGVLTVLDFFGDKIPVVDNLLHVIHTGLAPLAGGVVAASLDQHGGTGTALIGALGAGNALGVHGLKSATRVGTTALSFGFLNPIVSVVEDVVAVTSLALAFVAPFVFGVIALAASFVAITMGRRVVTWIRLKRSRVAA
jgi:hypothetical protein